MSRFDLQMVLKHHIIKPSVYGKLWVFCLKLFTTKFAWICLCGYAFHHDTFHIKTEIFCIKSKYYNIYTTLGSKQNQYKLI